MMTKVSATGAILQMLSHGLMTALFFALIGMIYGRTHTRDIRQLRGLMKIMPFLAVGYVIAGLANLGLPGLPRLHSDCHNEYRDNRRIYPPCGRKDSLRHLRKSRASETHRRYLGRKIYRNLSYSCRSRTRTCAILGERCNQLQRRTYYFGNSEINNN